MAKIIEASALISAKTGDLSGFAAIARQLESVSKAGEAVKRAMAGTSGDLAKRVSEISTQLSKIDNFRTMSRGLDQAGTAMRKAVQDANRLKSEMDAVAKPTRQMQQEYSRASLAVERATKAFREQGQAVRAARSTLADAGIPVNQIARQQATLTAALDRTTAAMKRQSDAGRIVGRPMPSRPFIDRAAPGGIPAPGIPVRPAHVPVAEVGGLIGAGAAVKGAVLAGFNVEAERVAAKTAGWTDEELRLAEARSHELAGKFGIAPATAMNLIRENRTVFGGEIGNTLNAIEPYLGVRTAMRQANPKASDEELNTQLGYIVKSGEILGHSSDPEKLKRFADWATRMSQVFGSTLRGEELVNYAKRGKTAASSASFDYMSAVLPTLLPEMGGDAVGTASMTLRQALIGGKMRKRTAEALVDVGLVDPKGIIGTKDDDIKGVRAGSVVGSKTLESNPLRWVNEHLIPAMDKKGIRAEDRPAFLSTIVGDRNAEHMLNLLVTQQARFAKDAQAVAVAKGIAGAEEALKTDPYVLGARVSGGAAQVGAALSEPFLPGLKAAADAAASALTSVAEVARGDKTSAGIGVGAGGLLGALLGGSLAGGSGIFLRGAGIAAGAGMGGIMGGAILPLMVREFVKSLDPRGPEAALWDQGFKSGAPGFQGVYEKSWQAQKAREMDPEAARGRAFMSLGRPLELAQPKDVTAKLEGSATVSARFEVQPSSELLRVVEKARSIEATGHLSAGASNGPGSNGRSQPEAQAPTGSSSAL